MKQTLFALCILLLISCSGRNNNSSFTPQTEVDIIKYIADNQLNAQRSDSGLYYVINDQGIGTRPTSSSNVTITYKGYFLDGTVFDKNSNGYTTPLNRVIKGWTEGVPYFNEGGEGILIVPSSLAYGNSGLGKIIPGGAVLVFNIKLISVN